MGDESAKGHLQGNYIQSGLSLLFKKNRVYSFREGAWDLLFIRYVVFGWSVDWYGLYLLFGWMDEKDGVEGCILSEITSLEVVANGESKCCDSYW